MENAMLNNSTVAAISTPQGKGGIAVIRISGENSIKIASRMFFPASGRSLEDFPPFRAVYGDIYVDGKKTDDGIATVFLAPRSFTGENTVEISCHGGALLQEKILQEIFKQGALPAGPGEFTKRAFINGKMSLSEAEAVISKINAESDEQLKLAVSHAEGKLSKEISGIINRLVKVLSNCYVLCDYPDEDLSDISQEEIIEVLNGCIDHCDRLIKSYRTGHAVAEGIPTVIVGQPNTGKSSLLNTFLGYDRAIVTNIAGTTRDIIEEKVYLGKVTLTIADTAGLRFDDGIDAVEKIGVSRSIDKLQKAELVLAVFDGSKELDKKDEAAIEILNDTNCAKIAVINKCDLGTVIDTSFLEKHFPKTVTISTADGTGMEELTKTIEELYFDGEIDYSKTAVLALSRQKNSVVSARESIVRARDAIAFGISPDVAGLDVEEAIGELEYLDGRRVSEIIVGGIFSGFCVGK